MKEVNKEFDAKMQKTIDVVMSDFASVRAGRANAAVLDKITVEESKYAAAVEDALRLYLDMRGALYAGKNKDICLMDMACIGTKYLKSQGKANNLDESEEINACSIKVSAMVDRRCPRRPDGWRRWCGGSGRTSRCQSLSAPLSWDPGVLRS